jgi:hypothetical protein
MQRRNPLKVQSFRSACGSWVKGQRLLWVRPEHVALQTSNALHPIFFSTGDSVSSSPPWHTVLEMLPPVLANNDTLHFEISQSCNVHQYSQSDVQKYVRNFRTVRFGMGQRTGTTSAVMTLAREDDLVLCPELSDLRIVASNAKTPHVHMFDKAVSDGSTRASIVAAKFRRLWVIDSYWCIADRSFLDRLYTLVRSPEQQFILLG